MKNKRTMNVLSYGFTEPADVLAKLERESAKLVYPPNNDDVFNFIITAAVLGEWVKQFYGATAARAPFSFDKNEGWKIPDCFADWITDTDCFPNKHYTMEREIGNVLGTV